jgi:hypothetical protein
VLSTPNDPNWLGFLLGDVSTRLLKTLAHQGFAVSMRPRLEKSTISPDEGLNVCRVCTPVESGQAELTKGKETFSSYRYEYSGKRNFRSGDSLLFV